MRSENPRCFPLARTLPSRSALLAFAILASFAAFLASCATAPNTFEGAAEDSADVGESARTLRYWSAPSGLAVHTVDGAALADAAVPHREKPRLLVVMYHNLVFGRTGSEYNRDIYNFEHDLAYLRTRFRIIGFDDLIDIRAGRKTLDTDAAIITFDDGDLSMYGIAYPLLAEYGIKATFFIVPTFVGEVGYMGRDHIAEMAAYRHPDGGRLFEFGSHSLTHARLGDLPADALRKELTESRARIREISGQPVRALALPFGSGSDSALVRKLASEAGFQAIRTSDLAAPEIAKVDLLRIPSLYVDNASTDRFVAAAERLMGR